MMLARKNYLKALLAAGLSIAGLSAATVAQNYAPSYAPAPPVAPTQDFSTIRYNAEQLDQMLAPIALYPDPLLSEVLAACTYPQDVASLGQYLQTDATPTGDEINAQTWDVSVKALASYPNVVNMMNSQMDWTRSVGIAFANQPADVMNSVQRLRGRAQAANNLVTTPQQEVIGNAGAIQILPAQPEVIYVPMYDPGLIYTTPRVYCTFGDPYGVSPFFTLGFDWSHQNFVRGVHWGHDWRRPEYVNVTRWEHDRRRPIPVPVRPFVPPRGVAPHRGWDRPDQAQRVLSPAATPRQQTPAPKTVTPQPAKPAPEPAAKPAPQPAAKPAQRPVTGLPNVPPRAQPSPTPVQPVQPKNPPTPPVQPRPVTPAPAPKATPAPAPPKPAAPVQRPVTGLPRAAPAAPPPKAAPAAPPPRAAPAPAPTFHSTNPAGSARGHQSMKR